MIDSAPVFVDGFGRRVVRVTHDEAPVEHLQVASALAQHPGFVDALRERVTRMAAMRLTSYARALKVDQDATGGATVISEYVKGWRLADLLDVAEAENVTFDIGVVMLLLRQLLPTAAMLTSQSRDTASGALGPEHLVLTPQGRLVLTDYAFGGAIERLGWSSDQLWRTLRVATPPAGGAGLSVSPRGDVAQIGVTMLSLVVGRRLRDDEFPDRLEVLVGSARQRTPTVVDAPLSAGLRTWMRRALQLEARSFASLFDARRALEQLLATETSLIAQPMELDLTVARVDRLMPAFELPALPAAPPAPPIREMPAPPLLDLPAPRHDWVLPAEAFDPPAKVQDDLPESALAAELAAYAADAPSRSRKSSRSSMPPATSAAAPAPVPDVVFDPGPPAAQVAASATHEAPPAPAAPEPAAAEAWMDLVKTLRGPVVPPVSPPAPAPAPSAFALASDVILGPGSVTPHAPASALTPAPAPPPPPPPAPPTAAEPAATVVAATVPFAPSPVFPSPASADVTPRRSGLDLSASIADVQDEARPLAPVPWWRSSRAVAALAVLVLGQAALLAWNYTRPSESLAGEGELVVQSRPEGARVVIDDEEHGVTPLTVRVAPGTHVLQLRVGGAEPRVIPLIIRAGVQTAQYVELQGVSSTGVLEVRSEPSQARVTIDGQARGSTPLTLRDVTPGDYQVVLERAGWKSTQVVRVEPGGTAQLVVPIR